MTGRWIAIGLIGLACFVGPGCVMTDCVALEHRCTHFCTDRDVKRVCLELAWEQDDGACRASYKHYARACPDVDSIFDDDDDFWDDD